MEINFRHEINGQKVITAVAQDAETNQILMLANMNKEALQKTVATGIAELDTRIGEGILEWIQVSPKYRRRSSSFPA